MLKVAIICGGMSEERGISLNSARSVYDHLSSPGEIEILVIYYDKNLTPYKISDKFLYSNTPSDFDFKLDKSFEDAVKLNKTELINTLKSVDIVFPVIHGYFGEDGKLQQFLEENGIPFVGAGSKTCKKIFNKGKAKQIIESIGCFSLEKLSFTKNDFKQQNFFKIENFLEMNSIDKVIVKPAESGSSIHIYVANNLVEIKAALSKIFSSYFEDAVIERFCVGKEFTVIILQNGDEVVPLIPLEVEVDGIFTYGKKYTPSNETQYFCPPRFPSKVIDNIRKTAKQLFEAAQANDFLRIDGWFLDNGKVFFADFNPISGMEQNSFIFQQSTRIGLTHAQVLRYILKNSCKRHKITFEEKEKTVKTKQRVNVIFGGITTEKEVSVCSGTNVWLKLLKSENYRSYPYFLENEEDIWEIPYSIALNHNCAAILSQCYEGKNYIDKLNNYNQEIRKKLGITNMNSYDMLCIPTKISFDEFVKKCKSDNAFVFLGLHGGVGENGVIQKKLEIENIPFNGSDSHSSALCMDKFLSGKLIDEHKIKNVRSAKKISFKADDFNDYNEQYFKDKFSEIVEYLQSEKVIIKPQSDGCSAGVAKIENHNMLMEYINCLKTSKIKCKINNIEFKMPEHKTQNFLFEECIETDKFVVQNKQIEIINKTGWIELTVGVLEKDGAYHSLNPSITIADGDVLSLEEKFQGGTGINITPPDEYLIKNASEITVEIKQKIELISKVFGIKNYARIDIFYNVDTHELIVIEVNTLPGLTPSTVLFQQAIKENPPLMPLEFLEKIITNKSGKLNNKIN